MPESAFEGSRLLPGSGVTAPPDVGSAVASLVGSAVGSVVAASVGSGAVVALSVAVGVGTAADTAGVATDAVGAGVVPGVVVTQPTRAAETKTTAVATSGARRDTDTQNPH
jgi:hypothetical protein